jgi:hypothetical protein
MYYFTRMIIKDIRELPNLPVFQQAGSEYAAAYVRGKNFSQGLLESPI